ncbi:MAG: histidine triad nucleotide-binding protein [Nitrospiraceae bacterium]
MTDCLFCRIVSGNIPAQLVHQDDHVIAFEDINPQAPTHILVIPKRHVPSVQDLEEKDGQLLGHLMLTCTHIAQQRGLGESGYRLVTNTGPNAGQTVFHLHMHVLGGRRMSWPPG